MQQINPADAQRIDDRDVYAPLRKPEEWPARRVTTFADLRIRDFRVVADDPGDPVGLVLALGNRGIARAFGAADLGRSLLHLQRRLYGLF